MPPSASSASDVVQKGDLVRLDFELWAESGGKKELVACTKEEVAKAAMGGEAPKGMTWGAQPHVVGRELFRTVFAATPNKVDASLEGIKVGQVVEKEFAPADAFGERDPKLIELFSMNEILRLPEMRQEDAHLDIGTVLNIRGRQGRVSSLTAGRVRVDFNRPNAGKKALWKFTVLERVTDPQDVVRAVLDMDYGQSKDFGVDIQGEQVTLTLAGRSLFDVNWLACKASVVSDLRERLKATKVVLVEEHKTPPAAEKKGAKQPSDSEKSESPPEKATASPPA
jgi:FKBP-type peptidyl-prolyl cis-trans isomerase 2